MADQMWQFRPFPAPDGEAAAVKFLNEPARQGRGEASVALRNDGTAGLLWLEPGSLGDSTVQTWQFPGVPGPGRGGRGRQVPERARPAGARRGQRDAA